MVAPRGEGVQQGRRNDTTTYQLFSTCMHYDRAIDDRRLSNGLFIPMPVLSSLPRLLALAAFVLALSAIPAAARADVLVRVSLSAQEMVVYVDGVPRYDWAVSTARRGYVTPTGSFRPTRMHRMWYSKKYDNAPMPSSIFFHGGYAVHGTGHLKALGRPASHGCVRLHPANARTLYSLVADQGMGNARIVITR